MKNMYGCEFTLVYTEFSYHGNTAYTHLLATFCTVLHSTLLRCYTLPCTFFEFGPNEFVSSIVFELPEYDSVLRQYIPTYSYISIMTFLMTYSSQSFRTSIKLKVPYTHERIHKTHAQRVHAKRLYTYVNGYKRKKEDRIAAGLLTIIFKQKIKVGL